MNEFANVIGYDAIKNQLSLIIDMIRNEELYVSMGAKMPHGILLYGEPGLGKTLLATSFIEATKLPSFQLAKNKAEAEMLQEIEAAFIAASEQSPCIVFIDDIDKLSSTKESNSDSEAFAAIQAGIDKVKDKTVIVVATANNINKLPHSLLRGGRFDYKIEVKAPTGEDAKRIIEFYLQGKRVSTDFDFEDASSMISYRSCADLQNILNHSAILAAHDRKPCIEIDHLVAAYMQLHTDNEPGSTCGEEQIEATAIHEAGHIAIAESLCEGSVGFACLEFRGQGYADGQTHLCHRFNRRPENVLIALGGKASSELLFGSRCASGCESDLSRAADLIHAGASDNATMGFGHYDALTEECHSLIYRERTEAAVQAEMERFFFLAKDAIFKNKDFVLALAKKLKDQHYILHSDIRAIRESMGVARVTLP